MSQLDGGRQQREGIEGVLSFLVLALEITEITEAAQVCGDKV